MAREEGVLKRKHDNEASTNAPGLLALAESIEKAIEDSNTGPEESINLCGVSLLSIIHLHPDDVLKLAHEKLHTWPYSDVPIQWRRLYEEASLWKVIQLLRHHATSVDSELIASAKKRRLDFRFQINGAESDDWMTEVVRVLDMGIALSGAPARRSVFDTILERFELFMIDGITEHSTLLYNPPGAASESPVIEYPIQRWTSIDPPTFEQFQAHLDKYGMPLHIAGALQHWPALQHWSDPDYLMRVMLGGRRLVPVELGRSYTDDGWGQKMMPFAEFMRGYLLPEKPEQVGYLAQHDLFGQIPKLRDDFSVPDYCYTSPPLTGETQPQLDGPLLNAWLGPGGTISPLHTDPYHDILCQVVGSKYIRLYAPSETLKLYPRGLDEAGVNMENTSHVDVALAKELHTAASEKERAEFEQQFPRFGEATYLECVLEAGECIYVPQGWWHYVESLSTSFSVSFWWN